MTALAWLAADWGTTRLRLWAMAAGGDVLESRTAEAGMGRLDSPAAFTEAFVEATEGWLSGARTLPVVVCGMAGAREGWQEAPYAPLATPLVELPALAVRVAAAPATADVRILPGLRQDAPPDVIRGEETKLLGLVAHEPDLDAAVLLPGTHDKWVLVKDGQVRRFATTLTGETFAALSRHTVLRHTLAGDGWDEAAFTAAVDEARREPAGLLRRAFGLRASALLEGLEPAIARARLSGWLVGMEIGDVLELMGRPERVRIVGAPDQRQRYTNALARFGVETGPADAEALTLEGLRFAHHRLFGAGQ
jgi:2-dehydro-3-deoxygalactonokinase